MPPRKGRYEPPLARDLSDLAAVGQVTDGICEQGTTIQSNVSRCRSGAIAGCASGNGPITTNPLSCSPNGVNPTVGGCSFGNFAETLCNSGSALSFG